MDSCRKNAIIVGLSFISATVASILCSVFLGSILDAPNYLTTVFAHGSQLIVTAIFWLIAAISAFATSFMLFPIIRRHIESLALGYFGLRLLKTFSMLLRYLAY